MWAFLFSRYGLWVAIFTVGLASGWMSHNAVLRTSGEVKTWWAERKAGKVNEHEATDATKTETTAAQVEASIREGADSPVSGRLDCLYRAASEGRIAHCVQDPVPEPCQAVPAAKGPLDGERDSFGTELYPKIHPVMP